mmetsp:Transcript_13776/g.24581  ORF Transcript_13776/g.24581 Transcript_13776/m.24581 type:complete len:235 (+) Transcript_13776:227-931(+)
MVTRTNNTTQIQPLLGRLINFLHLGLLGIVLLSNVLISHRSIISVINAQTQFDHPVDALSVTTRVIQAKARSQQRSVEQEPDQILNSLIRLVLVGLLLQLLDNGVARVQLHRLLGNHVGGGRGITESLGLHDTLHVGRPSIFASYENARRVDNAVRQNDLLDLVAQNLLDQFGQVLESGLLLFLLLLLLIGFLELNTVLREADELLVLEILQLLHGILINRVGHEENLVAPLLA